MELLLKVLLLGHELRVEVLVLSKVALEPRDLDVAVIEGLLLLVQLGVEIGILFFSVDQEVLLVVDLLPERGDHVDVGLHPALVVVLHPPLLVGDPVEVLLEVEQLILQILVLPLSLSELHGLLPELCDKPVLLVLSGGTVVEFSIRR